MRIISGKFKGKKLVLPDSKKTRPLRDFVKENIFNLITHSKDIKFNFNKSKICDLFSGSGSFGLECLSRGSESVIFVEQKKDIIKVLKRNISKMEATINYEVIENDVISFLSSKTSGGSGGLDLIFIDPPYQFKKNKEIFNLISKNFKNVFLIFHTHIKNDLNIPLNFKTLIEKKYGISRIVFLKC